MAGRIELVFAWRLLLPILHYYNGIRAFASGTSGRITLGHADLATYCQLNSTNQQR